MAKLTNEEFIKRVQENNKFFANGDIELNGKYAGRHTQIPAHCNIHNVDWNPFPAALYDGKGCPRCSREEVATRRSLLQQEFIDRLLRCNQFFVNGDLLVRGEYCGRHKTILCHCNIHGFDWDAYPATLYEGRGCPHCSWSALGEHLTMSNDEFVARVYDVDPELIVRGKYVNNSTPVEIECKEGHVWSPLPQKILHDHQGCPYCDNKRVWIGFNDMWTTRPDIANLLKDLKDGYRYTYGSGKYTYFTCPDCGSDNYKKINTVSSYGFVCDRCGDGISMPEKFGRVFLDQLPITNHTCEYQPEWAKPYYYDDYFVYNDNEYIVEWDGAFHYLHRSGTKQSLEERQAIDELKDRLAIQHNIHIIRIDCLLSEPNYIKQNILQSDLNNIFNLLHIDWALCNEKSQSNLVKDACKLYNLGVRGTSEIGIKLHVTADTTCRYLKRGAELGWCDYDPNVAKIERYNRNKKPINVLDDDCKVIHSFDSISSCETQMRAIYDIVFNKGRLVNSCKTHKPYKGFNFRFANETTQN